MFLFVFMFVISCWFLSCSQRCLFYFRFSVQLVCPGPKHTHTPKPRTDTLTQSSTTPGGQRSDTVERARALGTCLGAPAPAGARFSFARRSTQGRPGAPASPTHEIIFVCPAALRTTANICISLYFRSPTSTRPRFPRTRSLAIFQLPYPLEVAGFAAHESVVRGLVRPRGSLCLSVCLSVCCRMQATRDSKGGGWRRYGNRYDGIS